MDPSPLLTFISDQQAADDARTDAEIARDECEALRDMLEDARAELDALRVALHVSIEPHQSLSERMLEAAQDAWRVKVLELQLSAAKAAATNLAGLALAAQKREAALLAKMATNQPSPEPDWMNGDAST